ncbi:hypothetical protein [Bifidobacterium pseudocatenulatum]|uniref:hypothetical protein n=1 Tax=Bifidobacterium pseudocatenulatum TaxID=28026 RepID=UPI00321C354B
MTRATMRDIDEMGFNIQVWDYMNWALGDRNLGFDRRLHWMGEPVNVTTFKNADKPVSEMLDEARTIAADNDMRVWVVVQHVTGMNISGSLVLIPPETWTRLSQLDVNHELQVIQIEQLYDGLRTTDLGQFALLMNHLQLFGPDESKED